MVLSLSLSLSLSLYLTGGRPLIFPASVLLLYILLVNSLSSILPSSPDHLSVLLFNTSTTPQLIPSALLAIQNLPYTFSLLTIHPVHTTATSQVTHFNCLNLRPLSFVPRPGLTCKCHCRNYYAIPKRLPYFLAVLSLVIHSRQRVQLVTAKDIKIIFNSTNTSH